MQLILEFHVQELVLPLAYRYMVQGLIYSLASADPSLSREFHDGGVNGNGKQFKLFTFGQLEGPHKILHKTIVFPTKVKLEIRSTRSDFLLLLMSALEEKQTVELNGQPLRLNACSIRDHRISQDTIWIRTKSPVVAYITEADRYTRFFSPMEEGFYSLIETNARRKWDGVYAPVSCPLFRITPCKDGWFTKQVTTFKNTRVTAWGGVFRLEGDPALLNLLYNTGLGAKNSQGFGMFDPLENQ